MDKSKKRIIWCTLAILGVLLATTGLFFGLKGSPQPKTLELDEEGGLLYSSSQGSLRVDRVYIGEDGNAYIDYTAEYKQGGSCCYLDIDNVEINGWVMRYSGEACELRGGETTGKYLAAYKSVLDYSGITSIDSIRFDLRLNDFAKLSHSRSYHLVLGEDAEQSDSPRTPVADEQVIADTDDFTAIVERTDASGIFAGEEQCVLFYLHNRSQRTLQVDLVLNAVNNISYGITDRIVMSPGAQARLPMGVSAGKLAELGIASAGKLCYGVEVCDMETNDWLLMEGADVFVGGLTEETLPEYTRLSEEGEQVIVDNEHLTFVIYSAWREGDVVSFRCYVDNKTEHTLNLSTESPTVNGMEARANTNWYSFAPYRKSYEVMIFYPNEADNGDELTKLGFCLSSYLSVPSGEDVFDSIDLTDPGVVHEYIVP